ncbi:hypothetical protein LAZ67_17000254 [Cordylochernes scorpioides]|uniref:Reverse transcriptase zinc-binding domain-containing protein n=1 Tax=Cordylochernes scorpioides TaxID=51811 RepID=A0ABY6LF82_9ARAC|nr:hypothetical protein LAZ67_17000254 [Cordylochernes scorpioides]
MLPLWFLINGLSIERSSFNCRRVTGERLCSYRLTLLQQVFEPKSKLPLVGHIKHILYTELRFSVFTISSLTPYMHLRSFFPYDIPKYFRPNYYNSQFLTDHGNFRFCLKKIQAVQDSTCFCGLGEQTSIHLLLECSVFQDYRVNNDLIALGPMSLDLNLNLINFCVI